nr:hypothetical protein BaRGS_017138 [Batillaria attramentaria]
MMTYVAKVKGEAVSSCTCSKIVEQNGMLSTSNQVSLSNVQTNASISDIVEELQKFDDKVDALENTIGEILGD